MVKTTSQWVHMTHQKVRNTSSKRQNGITNVKFADVMIHAEYFGWYRTNSDRLNKWVYDGWMLYFELIWRHKIKVKMSFGPNRTKHWNIVRGHKRQGKIKVVTSYDVIKLLKWRHAFKVNGPVLFPKSLAERDQPFRYYWYGPGSSFWPKSKQ